MSSRRSFTRVIVFLALASIRSIHAGSEPIESCDASPAKSSGAKKSSEAARREKLENVFRESMRNVTLKGTWRLVRESAPDGDDIGEEKFEEYDIEQAEKIDGDLWRIRARIRFGEVDLTVPVSVRVLWAGDTPTITVTDLNIPGVGKYTARVMIYRGLYAGTWFGKNYGGIMSGRLIKKKTSKNAEGPAGAKKKNEEATKSDGAKEQNEGTTGSESAKEKGRETSRVALRTHQPAEQRAARF